MSTADTALIIFIKNPVKGKVKTRLAETMGDDEALRIYHQLLKITQAQTRQCNCMRYLFYSDVINHNDDWESKHYLKHVQLGDNLGERMQHAFEFVFKLGHSKAVIIGSDCPTLKTSTLNQALLMLNDNDVVIGPSEDGGYYLLGMNGLIPELFEKMPWSQPHLFKQSIALLERMEIAFYLLPTLNDIDTEVDWEDYRRQKRDDI